MPEKIFTQELEGTRRRVIPRKGWKEEVERDLQVLGVIKWRVGGRQEKMEGHCSTGHSAQWAVVPMEEEEEDSYIIWCKRSTMKFEFWCVMKTAWNITCEDVLLAVCPHPHSLKPQNLGNDRNHANFRTKKDFKKLYDIQYPNNSHNKVCSGKFSHTSPKVLPHQSTNCRIV